MDVVSVSRRPNVVGDYWDVSHGKVVVHGDERYDAVVHLAGEPIADGRWTEAKKEALMQSRVQGTRTLVEYVMGLEEKPKVVVIASGVGYYGDTNEVLVKEGDALGELYISEICEKWEAETEPLREAGVRVVNARLGMVLGDGGALAKMLPIFRKGLGGLVGNGSQWMSWVAMDDVVGLMDFVINHEELEGAVNFVSPKAVTNRKFTMELAAALKRPAWFPVPAAVVKLMFGQMGEEMLLSSCRVFPQKVLEAGYEFKHSEVRGALEGVIEGYRRG